MELDLPQALFWSLAVVVSLICLPPLFTKGGGHDFGTAIRWIGYAGFILTLCSCISSLSDLSTARIWCAVFVTIAAVLGAITYLCARFGRPYNNLLAVTGLWGVLGVVSSVPIAFVHFLFIHRRAGAFQIFVMLLVSFLFERLGVFCEFEEHGRSAWDHRESPFNHPHLRAAETSNTAEATGPQSYRAEVPEITYEQWIARESQNRELH